MTDPQPPKDNAPKLLPCSINADDKAQLDESAELYGAGSGMGTEMATNMLMEFYMLGFNRASQPLAQLKMRGPKGSCLWKLDDDYVYQTSCGESFVFSEDGPKENGTKFCCYCGNHLIEDAPPSSQQEGK